MLRVRNHPPPDTAFNPALAGIFLPMLIALKLALIPPGSTTASGMDVQPSTCQFAPRRHTLQTRQHDPPAPAA